MSDLVDRHDPIIKNLKDLQEKEKEKVDQDTITDDNILTRPVLVNS